MSNKTSEAGDTSVDPLEPLLYRLFLANSSRWGGVGAFGCLSGRLCTVVSSESVEGPRRHEQLGMPVCAFLLASVGSCILPALLLSLCVVCCALCVCVCLCVCMQVGSGATGRYTGN